MGTIHVYKPDGTLEMRVSHKPPSLNELKELVGGYIELVHVLFDGRARQMIVNEEGHLLDLPYNESATRIYHAAGVRRLGLPEGTILQNSPTIVGVAIVLDGDDVQLD